MGGMSAEYEISMKSGENVLEHIDREKFKVTPIEITRNGEWVFPGDNAEYLEFSAAIPKLRALHLDCIFIALHGPFGEDGRMQGLFDLMGIPYTGSGCAASALAIDKIHSKALMNHVGVLVPDEILFTHKDWAEDPDGLTIRVADALGFPCVIKNPVQGSSLGLAIPQNRDDFPGCVDDVLGFGYRIMVERHVQGVEVTCGVLDLEEEGDAFALPVTEIRPVKSKYFDYHAKYTPDAAKEITPAEISNALRDRVQAISIRAHELIGCRGFSRSDMIISGEDIYWLEVNTIPGLTKTSLLPQAAEVAGVTFSELITKLVEAALI